MAPNVKKTILVYAGIAFLLLGVLFGMNIMTFIFGSLGPEAAGLEKTSGSAINESGIAVNTTSNDTVAQAALNPGLILVSLKAAYNSTGTALPLANISFTPSGLIYLNPSTTNNDNFWGVSWNLSYTYEYDAGARLATINIQNDSLTSIQTYSNASKTQFSTISIAIILVILISLFLLFWTYFMGQRKERSSGNFT